ncbi:MAG TPA: hypothetical protein VJR46_07310 [Candidatus Dormibacteraeota bacterium]|nr:hypothetical protein [Candidatus Dormibacteraeota bacterium]
MLAGNGNGNGNGNPQDIDDNDVQAAAHRFGNPHEPNVDARTVQSWSGQATVGNTTYTYRMVGDDPAAADSATIKVDVVAIDLNVGGTWFRGSDAVDPVLGSPLFQASDYSSANNASTAQRGMGSGGALSAGNGDAQLVDATMRTQFNMVGTGYHIYLDPSAQHKAVEVDVPASAGVLMTNARHVVFAAVDETWMQTTVEDLTRSLHYLEPHRLALFLTNDVVLTSVTPRGRACCLFGAHGTTDVTAEGNGSDGRQALQTYVWSSWLTAGLFSPMTAWALQDIYGLSHELVEWAADPFLTNLVPTWKSPIAPQYGCSPFLETGDPVAGWGFSFGSNTFIDPADPAISPAHPHGYGDGSYHGSDEVLLPWFFGATPNTTTQPTQTASTNVGRYTFMGDLNGFSFFHKPAAKPLTAC